MFNFRIKQNVSVLSDPLLPNVQSSYIFVHANGTEELIRNDNTEYVLTGKALQYLLERNVHLRLSRDHNYRQGMFLKNRLGLLTKQVKTWMEKSTSTKYRTAYKRACSVIKSQEKVIKDLKEKLAKATGTVEQEEAKAKEDENPDADKNNSQQLEVAKASEAKGKEDENPDDDTNNRKSEVTTASGAKSIKDSGDNNLPLQSDMAKPGAKVRFDLKPGNNKRQSETMMEGSSLKKTKHVGS